MAHHLISFLLDLPASGWFVLTQSTAFFSLGLTSYILGKQLTRRIPYHSIASEIAVSTTLGLGVLGTLVLGLGVTHQLYPSTTIAMVVVIHLACYGAWRGLLRRCRQFDWQSLRRSLFLPLNPIRLGLAAAGLLGLLGLFGLLSAALYPPTAFDAVTYHLPHAQAFVETHSLPFSPELRYPVFPHLTEALFALVMFFWDDTATALVQTLCMFLVAISLYAAGREFFSRQVGLLAAALWMGNPVTVWFASVAYVDVGLAAFVSVGGLAFASWLKTHRTAWLVVSGLLLGFGAAIKYHGLFFVAALGLVSCVLCLRRRQLRLAGLLWIMALVVALPWYARIYHYTDNPLFPLFPGVFGHSEWSLNLAALPFEESATRLEKPASPSLAAIPRNLTKTGIYRVLTNPLDFFTLPWKLTLGAERKMGPRLPFSAAYLLFSPLLVWGLFRSSRIRWLMALIPPYVFLWYATGSDIRYLLYVLGFLSLATAAAVLRVTRVAPARDWLADKPQDLLIATLCLLALVPSAWLIGRELLDRGAPPTTEEQRLAYRVKALPPLYQTIEVLNERYGHKYRAYGVRTAKFTYYAQGNLLGDFYGPYRYSRVAEWLRVPGFTEFSEFTPADSAIGLYKELRSMKVRFLVAGNCHQQFKFVPDQRFAERFKLIFPDRPASPGCIWKLRIPPGLGKAASKETGEQGG